VCSAFEQENISLFNLLLALEVGKERGTVREDEFEFFLKNMLRFGNYREWRKADTWFVRLIDRMEKGQFFYYKRELLKLYPKRRGIFDELDGDNGYKFKDVAEKVNKLSQSESKP
jgi:hypothetical protein